MALEGGVKPRDRVVQFSVGRETKDDWMCGLVNFVTANGHYILGFSGEYGAEMSCMRFVADSPNEVRALLNAHAIHFCEREVVAVRLKNLDDLDGILRCLKAGEISVAYAYGLIVNAKSRAGIILMVDDVAAGIEMLARQGYEVLEQGDLSR